MLMGTMLSYSISFSGKSSYEEVCENVISPSCKTANSSSFSAKSSFLKNNFRCCSKNSSVKTSSGKSSCGKFSSGKAYNPIVI